jgi:anti-sigma B factor antagonist
MELRVVKQDQDLTHIALVGRLDVPSVQIIEEKFLEQTAGRGKPTLVDLSEVTFMGSTGLRMLLKAVKVLQTRGAKLVLLKPQPLVEQALIYVAFNQLMPIAHEQQQALELLKSA